MSQLRSLLQRNSRHLSTIQLEEQETFILGILSSTRLDPNRTDGWNWDSFSEECRQTAIRRIGSIEALQFNLLLSQLQLLNEESTLPLLLSLTNASHSRAGSSTSTMSTPKAHRGLFTGPAGLLPRIENPRPSTSQSQYSRGTSRHSRDFSGASPSNQHERESTSNSQSSKIELLSPPNIKNGRISMAAQLAAHRKKVASATRLSPVSETELLRDIIYILQGIDGKWIQFTEVEEAHIPGYDGVIIEPNNDLFTEAGIQFTTSTTHSIPAPTRDLLHTLAELGWLFKKISRGIEKGKEREDCGMIEQSLHSALGIELTEYFRLIAVLEGEVNDLNEEFEEGVGGENQSGALTLRRLLVWTEDIRLRMRMMAVLIEESKKTHRGGALLTSLHTYTSNGDPFLKRFSSRLLTTLSVPFFATLASWIYEGELRDPFNEFFVEDLGIKEEEVGNFDFERRKMILGHKIWQGKFGFRLEMLPGFLEESFAKKIFSTGKSLHFMRTSCDDSEWVISKNKIDGIGKTLQYDDMVGLESSISLAYSIASQRLFEIFLDKYKLLDHLKALKDYLMLGKGDFVEALLESLGPSLSKPANMLYRHNLTTSLDTAIKNSTSSADSNNIIGRLDARMSEFSQGEIGWDVFTLEYKIDSPLDTVLNPKSMEGYESMFRHLWQLKRVEFGIKEIHSRLMSTARDFSRVPELTLLVHQTRLGVADVRFFISQLQAYCHSEVIDCSWKVLEEFILKKEGDLDSLIGAHKTYLDRIVGKTLLITNRRSEKTVPLLSRVKKIFEVVLQYRDAIDSLCDFALSEAARQESYRDLERGIKLIGSNSNVNSSSKTLETIESRLKTYYSTFSTLATELVTSLGAAQDLDMRFLSIRENFNSHYYKPAKAEEPVEVKS